MAFGKERAIDVVDHLHEEPRLSFPWRKPETRTTDGGGSGRGVDHDGRTDRSCGGEDVFGAMDVDFDRP